jgi:hypothetical protein
VWLLASLLAAGNLFANGTLTLSCNLTMTGLVPVGMIGGNGCFQTSFINATALDSLNWGAPYAASGQSGLGAATGSSVTVPFSNRIATVDNDTVTIAGPAAVSRVDNFDVVWNGVNWVNPLAEGEAAGFAGHFNANTAQDTTATGDHLLKDTSGTPLELTFLQPATGVWFEIASLAGASSLFVAEVQAFDKNGNPIGSYTLTESGSYGSGGTCLTTGAANTLYNGALTAPTPCNDAPYVGFYDPQGRISSIYISVFDPSNLNSPIGFAIDSLQLDDSVPEPALPLMVGGGLAALALYRRKHHARVG